MLIQIGSRMRFCGLHPTAALDQSDRRRPKQLAHPQRRSAGNLSFGASSSASVLSRSTDAMTIASGALPVLRTANARCVRNDVSQLKALIFDLDGTLYLQGRVRRSMFYRLLRVHLTRPLQGLLTLKVLYAYRRAQEALRTVPCDSRDIATAQVLLAAKRVGLSAEAILPCITRWMEEEPLRFLSTSRRAGTVELLQKLKRRGLRLAVFSDYPADRKLAAMGIENFFDVVVTAQDPEVQRFKPNPRGLEVTLQRLAVLKHEAFYVGDRLEVDAVAARRAGIGYFILNGRQNFEVLLELLTPRQ